MIRDITIHAVLNGFTVQVGCQTVVFNGLDELIGELRSYLGASDPNEIEESWLRNSLNSRKLGKDGTPVPQFDVVPPVAEYGGIPVRQYTYPERPTPRDFGDFERPTPVDELGIPQPPPLGASGISQDTYIEVLRAMLREAEERRATGAADEG